MSGIKLEVLMEINKMDVDQLRELNGLVVDRMKRVAARKLDNFNVGDEVSFNGRHGARLKGKIIKINRTTVKVEVPALFNGIPQIWNVSPALIQKASKVDFSDKSYFDK